MILTLTLDTIGEWIEPGNYADSLSAIHFLKEGARELISLTFINGVWQWNLTPGNNIAFWSLAYEVPYYVVFGLLYFGGAGCRVIAVVLLVALGPHITILFGLWLFGMACYYLCRSINMSPSRGRALLIVSVALLCVSPYFAGLFPEANPWGGAAASLAQYYAAGIPFAGTIVGFRFAGLSLDAVATVVRWAAGATFTIYLMHVPFGMFLRGIVPSTWPPSVRWIGIYATVVILCFVGAQFTERKKDAWRLLFQQLIRRFHRQPSVTI
jgi:peptidoglycan/LPS O-acetylase OafA/YrhL